MPFIYRCQNCDYRTPHETDLNEIKDYDQRVAPDEAQPDGECPECGAVCHGVEIEVPADPEGQNDDRATWAEEALLKFGRETGQDLRIEPDELVSDFIADLMHWCDRNGVDFEDMVRRGKGHYEEETAEEQVDEATHAAP